MKTVPLGQITCNLDSKRIPLNGSERAKRSQTKLYPYIGANNVVDYIDDYIFDTIIFGPKDPNFITYRFFCEVTHFFGSLSNPYLAKTPETSAIDPHAFS